MYPSMQVFLERTVCALYEIVWGFLDTIPDITPKVRLSPPASSSDYLTAGSGLQ